MLARDGAGDAAVFYGAALLVCADEAARGVEGLDRAGEGSVPDAARFVPRQSPGVLRGAARLHLAGEVQLLYRRAGLDIAEEARVRAVRREAEAL